ncbi:hypothetical protein SAMN04488067_102138 [Halorubrum xinjiangense]|uniref:Uncharacterized protein n=1 Tax=Halorubrum xinjiangense TaxID=261291 RepID=A0A1G7IQ98_9EURY|nr:hypothetical protein [Halorubrum xinjiangense]SDF14920.1 hypothetical protein SAMN04488067_102138 [Halorubrum xinjiangense]
MKRRKFIISACGITAASSGLVGTGAFSAAQIAREANIAVVSDTKSLIGLVPNPDVAGVHDNNGELTIDLDDPGINQNSVYQFGFFAATDGVSINGDFPVTADAPSARDDGEFGSAFLIANQTGKQQQIKIDYRLEENDDEDSDGFDTSYWFEVHRKGTRKLLHEPVNDTAEITLGSGEACGVSFILQVPGDTTGEEITGSLSVAVGEAVDG